MTPAHHDPGLARYARECIRHALGGPEPARPASPDLDERAATFVTLRRGDELQGCIGTVTPRRPLVDDVASNAVAAALDDPRALPLSLDEVDELEVEVSILSPLEPIAFADQAEALAALRPGTDGVVLACGRRQATFLPQVWESLPDAEDFLAHLKRKAGLPAQYWDDDLRLSRYTVETIRDAPSHPGVSIASS